MKSKTLFGSSAGAVLLVGIGGSWVISNFETLARKALELGVKLAVKRGMRLTPETGRLLLELSGGVAGAAAGTAGQAASPGQRATKTTSKPATSPGQRATGKSRKTGTGDSRRVTKAPRSRAKRGAPA